MRQRFLATALSVLLASPALAHFSDGQIYVCDATNSQVYRVDPVTWAIFNSLDESDGLVAPRAIGLSHTDDMLIANYTSDVVLKFDNDLVGGAGLDASDGINGPKGRQRPHPRSRREHLHLQLRRRRDPQVRRHPDRGHGLRRRDRRLGSAGGHRLHRGRHDAGLQPRHPGHPGHRPQRERLGLGHPRR